MANTSDPSAYAEWKDVQAGFERPIHDRYHSIIDVFLARASRRLRILKSGLVAALRDVSEHSDLALFVKDMVVDAAERKLRNPGGFSHEAAGVFSTSRYDDFAKGRITFDPEDLKLLDGYIDATFGEVVRGPVQIPIPAWRLP
jgi:hypothetical protein